MGVRALARVRTGYVGAEHMVGLSYVGRVERPRQFKHVVARVHGDVGGGAHPAHRVSAAEHLGHELAQRLYRDGAGVVHLDHRDLFNFRVEKIKMFQELREQVGVEVRDDGRANQDGGSVAA